MNDEEHSHYRLTIGRAKIKTLRGKRRSLCAFSEVKVLGQRSSVIRLAKRGKFLRQQTGLERFNTADDHTLNCERLPYSLRPRVSFTISSMSASGEQGFWR